MFNKFLFLLVVLVFVSISPAKSGSNSYNFKVVNLDAVYSSLPEMEIAQRKLQSKAESLQKSLKKKYEELMRLSKALQAAGNNISPSKRKDREEKIMKLQREFTKEQSEGQQKIREKEIELISPIETKIQKVVQNYSKSLGLSAVFGYGKNGTRVLYANNECDITNQVLQKLKTAK